MVQQDSPQYLIIFPFIAIFKMHIYGVNLSPNKIMDLTKVTELFCTVNEIMNDLARLKNTLKGSQHHLDDVDVVI